jgi:hypothetical protein
MSKAWVQLVAACCLFLVASAPATAFQTTSPDSQATSASDKSKSAKSSSTPATESEIAAAKASGRVWVNLDSGVYHKGGRWYGKTKNGKFMTVDEAKKAGYKAAKRD